mmetsp:Transcript_23977/g.42487  ORF Transcript_23977/g.42487 Transcript_23977/m.42487 type:complete len:906 (-) Transcript_23977:329-3046(-)
MDVCKTQQCAGVVYLRYVSTSTFACANDAKSLPAPCDISLCPGIAPPPPSPSAPLPGAPRSPAGTSGSSGSSSGSNWKIPSRLLKPIKKVRISVPTSRPQTKSAQPEPLSTKDPVGDIGFSSVDRDFLFMQSVNMLWGNKSNIPNRRWPTHAFWENLVVGQGTDEQSAITALPYILQATGQQLKVAYPYVMSSAAQTANMYDLQATSISFGPAADPEHDTYKRDVVAFDDLSVSLRWTNTKQGGGGGGPRRGPQRGGKVETTILQGDPFVTLSISDAAGLRISSEQTLVLISRGKGEESTLPIACDANQPKAHRRASVSGSVFDVYNAQTDETWRLYTFPETTLTCPYPKDKNHTATKFESPNFEGTARLAIRNNCTTGLAKHCFETSGPPLPPHDPLPYASLLDAFSSTVPKGGYVTYSNQDKDKEVMVSLHYESESISFNKDDSKPPLPPLLLALPHHIKAGAFKNQQHGGVVVYEGSHRSMIGQQKAFSGYSIRLSFPKPDVLWGDERDLVYGKENVVGALKSEQKYEFSLQWKLGVGDPYNAGKLNARIARLAIIADQLNETETRERFLDNLQKSTELWLSGSSPNPLVYDKDMGGIVSCGCLFDSCNGKCTPKCTNGGPSVSGGCPTMGPGAFAAGLDFGNGYYNDHHFHYGYHLYAVAVLAKYRKEWVLNSMEHVLLLIRDVANPSKDDPFFPRFRHMDWYIGHSWAGGVFRSFANGRNQESTSEAVNCWYSIALLGDALGDKNIKSLGMALLAQEVAGAQAYWHIMHDSDQYDPVYAHNGITGILWSNLAQYQTWFGQQPWAINGIQMLPFTPISSYLLDSEWMGQQMKGFKRACKESDQCTSDGWSPLVCMAQAIVDPSLGLECAKGLSDSEFSDLTAEGNGNSKTNTFHFIASMGA